jgi:uncharacterized protein
MSMAETLPTLVGMQMIERPWGIASYGAASVKATPDLVRIRFKVIKLEQTPAAAFAEASDAVRAVRQALRDHGIPDGAVEGSRLDLKSAWTYGDKRKFLGYQCSASFAVESGNLDDVQPLLVDIVAAGANELEAVEFDVRAKADLRAEARKKAVAAARGKAELYAEAAGVRLGSVIHIDDVNSEHQTYRSHSSYAAEAAAADLAPGHVVVSAAVILGLSISQD